MFDFPFVVIRVLVLFICLAYFSELVHWLVVAAYLLNINKLFGCVVLSLHRVACFREFGFFLCYRFVCLFIYLFACLFPNSGLSNEGF